MSLQLKPPPERTLRRALEALFREARRLERRRRYALIALIAAGGVAAVAYGASGSGGGRATARSGRGGALPAVVHGRVVELDLSRSDRYDTITRLRGRLVLSGRTVAQGKLLCDAAVVDPVTLTLSDKRSGSCEDPALSGEPVLPIVTAEPRVPFFPNNGIATETVRISYRASVPPGYRVGPVVMRYPQISTSSPSWAYGDGYLWLYDGTTGQGSELLRISLTSGVVTGRVAMPNMPRPILAADADVVWIAPAVNGAGDTVYHLAPAANHATAVFKLTRQYVAWIVAAGHNVWLDTASGGKTQTLWRLTGASAKPTLRMTLRTSSLGNEVQAQRGGSVVVGDAAGGLWTAVPPRSGNTQRIVRINPATGRLTTIAVITPAYSAPNAVAYGSYEAVTLNGSMFLLDPPTGIGTGPGGALTPPSGFSALYRITPTTTH
jgi:hypothetical protein